MIHFNDQRKLNQSEVYEIRKTSILRLVPDVFSRDNVLYIGANPRRQDYLTDFQGEVDILEGFPANVRGLTEIGWKVFHGDVRKWNSPKRYDLTFWWHGPEHVGVDELAPTLERIESYSDTVVLGCPWGHFPQGAVGGNDLEIHRSEIQPDQLEQLGYDCDVTGLIGVWSNITAIKRLT